MIRRAALSSIKQMVQSPRTGARLRLVAEWGDAVIVYRRVPPRGPRLRPRGGGGVPHVHRDFDETFRIRSGIAVAWRDGVRERLSSHRDERTFYAPRGAVHVNPCNDDDDWLEYVQMFHPATDGVRAFLLTLADMLESGRDSDDGVLPVLPTLAVFDETDAGTYVPWVPTWTQRRVLLPVGAKLASYRKYPVTLSR